MRLFYKEVNMLSKLLKDRKNKALEIEIKLGGKPEDEEGDEKKAMNDPMDVDETYMENTDEENRKMGLAPSLEDDDKDSKMTEIETEDPDMAKYFMDEMEMREMKKGKKPMGLANKAKLEMLKMKG